ncbi:DeoR family transcriptional regulator [Bacteroides sp. BFG-606]|nr:DeoR family transcriptional regulator [Bacteroides sp. BFG-606]
MALNQRRVKILNLIREDGHAKVQDLSKIFKVTDVTIRQDLEVLENMGYIQREHGGAFLKDVGSFAKTGQLLNQSHIEEKRRNSIKSFRINK